MKTSRTAQTVLYLAAAALLSACAAKSHVKADGTTDNPVFPKPYSVTFDKKQGTFPTADELERMKPGLSKDDIYKILGRPHYNEGMFGVREWNYLFHFHTPGVPANPDMKTDVEGITTCQYKVLFDKHKYARSFHWKPVFPEDAVCPPVQETQPAPEPQIIIREVAPETHHRIRN